MGIDPVKDAGALLALAAATGLALAGCGRTHHVEMLKSGPPRTGPAPLTVRADLPAGNLRLSAGSPNRLYDLAFSYCSSHFRAAERFWEPGRVAGLAGSALLEIAAVPIGREVAEGEPNLMALRLRTGIPLDLRMSAGRGAIDLDLTSLGVRRLSVHGGTGAARVRFEAGNSADLELLRVVGGEGPVSLAGLGWGRVTSLEYHGGSGGAAIDWGGPGPREAAAFLDPGTGGLALSFPADLSVTLSGAGIREGSLTRFFHRAGGAWVSANASTASRRLTIVLDPGTVDVDFRWGRGGLN
jgi:hypothetical protein